MTFSRQFTYATYLLFHCMNIAHSTPLPTYTTNFLLPSAPSSPPTHPRSTSTPSVPEKPNGTISLPVRVLEKEVGYTVPLQLGQGNQTFDLFLDSINFFSFVEGSQCDSCGNHTLLSGQETTNTNMTFTVSFPTQLGNESLVVGEFNPTTVAVGGAMGNLSLFTALKVNDNITASAPFDGVLGLAVNANSEQSLPNFVQQLAEQGIISSPVLTLKLPSITNTTSQEGEVILGVPAAIVGNKSQITQPNATINGRWDLQASINVEGTTLQPNTGNLTFTASVSTRHNVIGMPAAYMQALVDAIPNARKDGEGFALPCNATTNISLEISGKQFALPPQNFISNVTSPQLPGFCFTRFSTFTTHSGPSGVHSPIHSIYL